MAWSYRSDRADEIYASSGGPAAATTEQLPRPPAQGESTDDVLNPPEVEPGKERKDDKKDGDKEMKLSDIRGLPGISAADLRVLEAQRQDPHAGPEVPSPADRLRQESELTVKLGDLEKQRQANIEKDRMRSEERTRIQQEEQEKENEKMRKEVAEDVKKEEADRKKKEDENKKKREEEEKTVREKDAPKKPATPTPAAKK